MSAQTLNLKLAGLWTQENQLSSVPDGALAVAENISLSQDSIAQSRRGFASLFSLPGGVNSDTLSQFQTAGTSYLIAHYGSSHLGYWDGSTFHAFSGSYSHPNSNFNMKFAQANQNLYFTTSNGVYKLDILSNTPIPAGVPGALDCEAVLVNTSGFLNTQSSVAYRVVWGYTDANSNLILSAPSNRAVINNPSGSNTQTTNVTFTIPQGITVAYFYQIYRSDQIAFTGSNPNTPDDNMQLVYEANPTSGQISAGTITVNDVVPDALRGTALYTNATQQGILQQNTIPPFCTDICQFKNCLFFANTSTAQNIQINMLSAGGSNGVQSGDTITIGSNTFTAGASQSPSTNTYQLVTSGSPSQNLDTTAQNLVQCINQSSSNSTIYAYYVSSNTSLPGQILLQARSLSTSAFTVTVSGHGSAWNPVLPTSGSSVISTNTAVKNGLMYSKSQQPESVPALNIFYPGSQSYQILRMIPLRDSLFILKEDGVFRLTGTDPSNFAIDTIDNTVFLTAPNSAVALGNCVYALTTQGVVQITDTGVTVISRQIEDQLNQITGTVGSTINIAFGVSYESERSYLLFLPQVSGSTYCNVAYVYNYFTKTWVTWNRNQLAGVVLKSDNKVYLANATTTDVSQERKDFTYTDYCDEALSINITSYTNYNISVSDASHVNVGDIVYQNSATFSLVESINYGLNIITVKDLITWSTGSTQLLQGIECTVQWLPQSGQNPGMLKHFSEGSLIFKQVNFTQANINYNSDLVGSFNEILISGSSPLGWGLFQWGTGQLWGGVSNTSLIRHYIPRDSQRCTLLTPQFYCRNAYGNFQLQGLSLQFNPISSRSSR
jgi:hypothetical protein